MYPIPADFDANCFVGSTLYEFCVNANQIRLKFDSGLEIVVEGQMTLRTPTRCDDTLTISPQSPSIQICSLIETEVISMHLSPNRMNLTLVFTDGHYLELVGDDPYECYRIQTQGREVIV
jgi:hypothetical protein